MEKEKNLGYISIGWLLSLFFATFITGTIYIPIQWHRNKAIVDAIFVSMLIAATMILILGLKTLHKYLVTKGFAFYAFVFSTNDPQKTIVEHEKLCDSVFNFKYMTISGIIYGFAIGSSPFILGVWKNDIYLRLTLSLLLFFVNFATGISFYSLILFFYKLIKLTKRIKVDLWLVDNPLTKFLSGVALRVSLFTSIYICICISSILFSVIPVGGYVLIYSCFSATVLLASIVIPVYPLALKRQEVRAESLKKIDERIQLIFEDAIGQSDNKIKSIELSNLDSLLKLREKVANIEAWPFKFKTVSAILSVLFFSSIPVLLQCVIEIYVV